MTPRETPQLSEEELFLLAATDKVRYAALCVHMAARITPERYTVVVAALGRIREELQNMTAGMTALADACPVVIRTERPPTADNVAAAGDNQEEEHE